MQLPDTAPFTEEQRAALNQVLPTMSPAQMQWLVGFAAGVESILRQQSVSPGLPNAPLAAPALPVGSSALPAPASAGPIAVTIVYGSESGNAEGLAHDFSKAAKKKGMAPAVKDMGDCQLDDLAKSTNLVVITSTWGDGDPPDNAVELHTALMNGNAPSFSGVDFSVLALGDTSYEKFCQTGKDFDRRLEELGGNRIADRIDCDLDFDEPFQKWMNSVLDALGSKQDAPAVVTAVGGSEVAPAAGTFGKKNPFPSALQEKILLNGRGSAKETWHYEFSLANSGLTYAPGDSLAVIPQNAPDAVEAVLKAGGFSGSKVDLNGDGTLGIDEALLSKFDCTTLTKAVMGKYNEFAKSKKIDKILNDSAKLKEYLWGRQIVDLLEDFPVKKLTADQFVSILRKMPPRLYSIASSLKAHPDEVHLTVASVRYNAYGRDRKGVASTFLADAVSSNDTVPVFVTPNKHFKLPADSDTPIIMVGPGTGVAPFRAFVEEREATGAKGKNWLFFGDQRFSYDFLYQLEWLDYLKDGILNKLDVAFSRDQKEKVYVQDRMLENAEEVWSWIDRGAYFYVCGDATRMAPDVHEALIQITEKSGGKSRAKAEEYVQAMQKEKRYVRDVY